MTIANTTPFVPGPYKKVNAIPATANTDQTQASGAKATVYAGGAQGSYAKEVDVVVPATNTLMILVIGVTDGTNLVAVKTVLIPAFTVSATQQGYTARIPLDIYIPNGGTMYASVTVSQACHCSFTIADY